jgi:hypothetical protein
MWAIFKLNVLLKMASGQYADDVDSFAEMYAEEYDRCIKRGGDMLYGVPVINGNTAGMAKIIKEALKKGSKMGGENYNILAEIYPSAFEAYWMGAEMSPLPNFLLKPAGWPSTPPAPGAVMNIGPNPIPMAISAAIHKALKEALKEAEEQLKSQEITIPGIGPVPTVTINVYETLEKMDKKEPIASNIRNHPIILAGREIRNQLKQAKKKKPSIGAQIKKALKFPFPELPKRQKIIDEAKKQLIELFQSKNIGLEGNITKLIDSQGDEEFAAYLKQCTEKDVATRKKRLEMTKQVQTQNATLTKLNQDNERMMDELQNTLTSMEEQKSQIEAQNGELVAWKQENEKIGAELVEAMKQSEQARMIAENAKNEAENNLDMIQKKTQFELINNIVKVALYVIIGVGGITTGIYVYSMSIGMDTDIIGSTWSNMFGILLTNSFSIVGTILGVKYGTSPNKEEK